jgi:hypothetical protein
MRPRIAVAEINMLGATIFQGAQAKALIIGAALAHHCRPVSLIEEETGHDALRQQDRASPAAPAI